MTRLIIIVILATLFGQTNGIYEGNNVDDKLLSSIETEVASYNQLGSSSNDESVILRTDERRELSAIHVLEPNAHIESVVPKRKTLYNLMTIKRGHVI
ncbi:hypothetical protein [Halalkalibacter urbisdiaboli]|uniref:hypothetical protein n=1 Tax=Halalkalibacter urbisdiaboli TaxID=1960589 RepID=UPI000B437356|nr:hypothetical protein [Halalkalibacter urbisdiaboli]